MEITLEQFKLYIPTVTLTDPEIERYLTDAKRAVTRDGFSVSHKEFDELQRFYALGLMQEDKVSGVRTPASSSGSGSGAEGISSISVAGISVGFRDPNTSSSSSSASSGRTSEGKTGYFLDYDVLKRKLQFPRGRIV